MRLLECHIENFGKVHSRTFRFGGNLNVICRENGWGKSTLAAFLCAMFYGFDGERKKDIRENERRFFAPWQGGVYGGTVTFEAGGKSYVAARTFGTKEAQDTFEIRDAATNLVSKDYSLELGRELFGIDRASFRRTVFIGQQSVWTAATDDIHAKVSRITDRTLDMNHYQKAQDKLTQVCNFLTPRRSTGSVFRRKEQLDALQRKVADAAGTESSLREYRAMLEEERKEYEECGRRRREIQELQREAVRIQNAVSKRDEWTRLKENAKVWEEKQKTLREEFPGEVPGREEIEERLAECEQLERAKTRESVSKMSPEEELFLAECEPLFRDGLPESAELEEMLESAQRLLALEQEYAGLQLSVGESARLETLEELFGGDEEAVSSMAALWNMRNLRKAALPSNRASLSMLQREAQQKRRKGKQGMLFWISGGALCLFGLLFAALSQVFLGAVLGAAGILLAAAGFLVKGRKREAGGDIPAELAELMELVQGDEEYIQNADERTDEYLRAHGRTFEEETASEALQELSGEYAEYLGLKRKEEKACGSSVLEEIHRLKKTVGSFLERFGVSAQESEFARELYALKNRAQSYPTLKEKERIGREGALEALRREQSLADFFDKYRFEPKEGARRCLDRMRDLADALHNAEEMAQKAVRELESFEKNADMSVLEQRISGDIPTLEELNRQNQEITEKMDRIQDRIRNYLNVLEEKQEELEELEEEKSKLQEAREALDREQQMFSDVQKARNYLEAAKEAITARYTAPLLKAFSDSYQAVTGKNADAFHIDANTNVTVDGGGMQREVVSLSAGYRDLVGICMRVALVDAMYEQEIPMLIMDDPFANLDDEKVREALEYLKRIAASHQVIYFTCSEMRAAGTPVFQETSSDSE